MQTRILLAAMTLATLANSASAELVTNGDFETDVVTNPPGFTTTISGWTIEVGGGLLNDAISGADDADGVNWAYINQGGSISQKAGSATVADGDQYNYSLFFAEQSGNGPVVATIALYAGDPTASGMQVATADIGPSLNADPAGTVYPAVGVLTIDYADPLLDGADLYIELTNTRSDAPNRNILVDDVSLTLVPEPGSLALLGLGGLALVRRRRA